MVYNKRMVNQRNSKYTAQTISTLQRLGHATNNQILNVLRIEHPNLSATTVHRLTARLAERGIITTAPSAADGSCRYDANTATHDHFVCKDCHVIRDVHVSEVLIPHIEKSLDGCKISGSLTVQGTCKLCAIKGAHN